MSDERWPDFFIVGAPRAGTTSLYEYLRNVPGIFLPKIKEPNYFSLSIDQKYIPRPVRNKQKYLNLFKDARGQKTGEASPQYLWDPKAAKLIHDIAPNARIIIMIRDPIKRAHSHYLLSYALGRISVTFSELIKNSSNLTNEYERRIFECGLYFQQVKRYLDLFGPDSVKVLIFEEFVKDTKTAVKQVLQFLGVNAEPPASVAYAYETLGTSVPYSRYLLKNEITGGIIKKVFSRWTLSSLVTKRVAKNRPKPPLLPEDRNLLENFYREDVKNLQNLLGNKLPWKIANN